MVIKCIRFLYLCGMEWKYIKGYEGLYKISDSGVIWNVLKNREVVSKKRIFVSLKKDGMFRPVKLLPVIAQHFVANPNGFRFVAKIDESGPVSAANLQWLYSNHKPKRRNEYVCNHCGITGKSIKKNRKYCSNKCAGAGITAV